jgi:predicted nucleic acid binding AN1-type Zn finger protein
MGRGWDEILSPFFFPSLNIVCLSHAENLEDSNYYGVFTKNQDKWEILNCGILICCSLAYISVTSSSQSSRMSAKAEHAFSYLPIIEVF